MSRSYIQDTAIALPKKKVSSAQVEQKINKSKQLVTPGVIELLLGVKNRSFSTRNEWSSSLACNAIDDLIAKNTNLMKEIDLLIYASATQDCIEPSTAAIICGNYMYGGDSFDVKNACNSFFSAFILADQYIRSGTYSSILICGGENPTKSIRRKNKNKEELHQSFSSFGFGDCGYALHVTASSKQGGILIHQTKTNGSLRNETTILGGGSRFPRNTSKNYFIGNPMHLKDFFLSSGVSMIHHGLEKLKMSIQDIEQVYCHQVSQTSIQILEESLSTGKEQITKTIDEYGNIASATLPLQIFLNPPVLGKKYLFVGLGAGASCGYLIYQH